MKTKITDLSKVLKEYSNKWIALDPEKMKVVASGTEPKTVLEQSRKKGIDNPVLTRAPKNYGAYIL